MRALVQSGGGKKGAFHLGVLDVLIGEQGREYDYMAGVSVGALNTGMLAQFPEGELEQGLRALAAVWEDLGGTSSVWKHWFLHQLAGVWKDSFYDSSPLAALVAKHFDQEKLKASGRVVRFGAVAYGSGNYYEATEKDEDLGKWILASAAFPGFLTPMKIAGDLWVDGGARRVTPLKGAIDYGCNEIDVILSGPRKTVPKSLSDNFLGTKRSALTISLRALEVLMDEIFERDVKVAEVYNEAIRSGGAGDKRLIRLNVYEPLEPFPGDSLTFDPVEIAEMRAAGREVARDRPSALPGPPRAPTIP